MSRREAILFLVHKYKIQHGYGPKMISLWVFIRSAVAGRYGDVFNYYNGTNSAQFESSPPSPDFLKDMKDLFANRLAYETVDERLAITSEGQMAISRVVAPEEIESLSFHFNLNGS